MYWGITDEQQCCDHLRWMGKDFSQTYTGIHSPPKLPSHPCCHITFITFDTFKQLYIWQAVQLLVTPCIPWWLSCKEFAFNAGDTVCPKDPLEEEIATYFIILAWKILWTEATTDYSPWVAKSDTTMYEYSTSDSNPHSCLKGRRDDLRNSIETCILPYGNGNDKSKFNAWNRALKASALGRPWVMGWGRRWERGSGWGTHGYPWLVHVNVWQKPLQYCRVISLQLK